MKTTPYEINVEKTVDGMDSLKIVLLADTHFGYSMGTAQAKRIVKKINTENPDVVCIAGDIFDNEYDAISKPDKLKEILKGIKSKYGVYACWGNHDLNEPILQVSPSTEQKITTTIPEWKNFLQTQEFTC